MWPQVPPLHAMQCPAGLPASLVGAGRWPAWACAERTISSGSMQEVAFFDKDENSSGSLSSELAVDTSHIRGAVGDQVGLITQNVVTFVAGYIIAFIASWKVTLVLTSILPLIVVASVVSNKFEMGENDKVGCDSRVF